jgi:multisubunit Na+/H+ antiporter MnhF subunit
MSLEFYKILHILGLVLLTTGLMSFVWYNFLSPQNKGMRILSYSTHGVGLLFILVSGFGMLARLGITNGLPNWIKTKLAIWVLMGLAITLIRRTGKSWPVQIALMVATLGFAGWLGILKPF